MSTKIFDLTIDIIKCLCYKCEVVNAESVTSHSVQPEIAITSRENDPILMQSLFGGLQEGYTLLDIAESTVNIFKLRDDWSSKKEGEIIGIRTDLDVNILLQRINAQEPADAVTMLGQLHQITEKEDKIAILAAIKSKLKPGGKLLVTVPVSSGMRRELAVPNGPKEYETMVTESGLTVIHNFLKHTADTKTPNNIYEIIAQKPALT